MAGQDLAVTNGLVIPGHELEESASRAGGPGGQHVNKANTRVTLRWNVRRSRAIDGARRERLLHRLGSVLTREGELIVHADGDRSRARNLASARRRLSERVARALRVERARHATRPTLASRQRRLDRKRQQSQRKSGRRSVRVQDTD